MEHQNRELELLQARQASLWVQVLHGPTGDQRAGFVRWLKESPRNVRDFLFMLTVDQALDHLDVHRLHDIESLIAQANASVVPFTQPPTPVANNAAPGRWHSRAVIAACGLALAVIGWSFWMRQASGWQEFATATGEQRAFELEDGSVIHLNTRSRVALRFAKQSREVRLLKGEALFRVQHDTSRPFRVYTADAVIQAVGTQFNVYARTDGTDVAVIEGRVDVFPEAHPALETLQVPAAAETPSELGHAIRADPDLRSIGVSEGAHINNHGKVSVRAVSDVADVVAWRQRRLVFRDESLAHIVAEFNRYGPTRIELDGDDVSSRSFSGVFDADDPESLAQVLARDATLTVQSSNHVITVRRR